jgi:hypothetical protein
VFNGGISNWFLNRSSSKIFTMERNSKRDTLRILIRKSLLIQRRNHFLPQKVKDNVYVIVVFLIHFGEDLGTNYTKSDQKRPPVNADDDRYYALLLQQYGDVDESARRNWREHQQQHQPPKVDDNTQVNLIRDSRLP